MNLTKEDCQKFLRNPTINPLTGRKIQVGKITHLTLMKECRKESPKKSPPSANSRKHYVAPPMGPMIHWEVYGQDKEESNMIVFLNYFVKRLKEIDKAESISLMEITEISDILKEAHSMFEADPNTVSGILKLRGVIKGFSKRKDKIINDEPKYHLLKSVWKEIKPERIKIRGQIAFIYSSLTNTLEDMKYMVKNKKITSMITGGKINALVKDKEYIDYVIKHNIFSYDDMYKNTFPSESVFQELGEVYKEYVQLYKKTYGESP